MDGALNPYLAATAVLAAGLDGIENKLDPGQANTVNMYETTEEERVQRGIDVLPTNLLDAMRNLEKDDVLREAFGKTPDGDYIDYFAKVKQREWKEYHDQVTDWEVKKYLTLF